MTTEPKRYTSVVEMVEAVFQDSTLTEELKDRIHRRRLVSHLMIQRAVEGVSQQELAARMGCTQSRISKLEQSFDEDLRFGDVAAFLEALDRDLRVVICPKDWTAAEQIRFHAEQIQQLLADSSPSNSSNQRSRSSPHAVLLGEMAKVLAESAAKIKDLLPVDAEELVMKFERSPTSTTPADPPNPIEPIARRRRPRTAVPGK